jgi:hypothetical protein
MAPTPEIKNPEAPITQKQLQDQLDMLKHDTKLNDAQKKDLETLGKEVRDFVDWATDAEQTKAKDILKRLDKVQEDLKDLANNVKISNAPSQTNDDRLQTVMNRTEKMLILTQATSKEAQFLALNTELKILKEMLDYINLNDQALWDEIVQRNKWNNTSLDQKQESDTKRAARRLVKGKSDQDPSDDTYVNVKNHPKLGDLMRKMRSLGKEYSKLETITQSIPVIVARIWAIEWELMRLSPDFGYEMNFAKQVASGQEALKKTGLVDVNGDLSDSAKKIITDSELEIKAAKSPNAIKHIYNDLHAKFADTISKTWYLSKEEAWSLATVLSVIWAAIFGPKLWSNLPGSFWEKVAWVWVVWYFGDKVLAHKSKDWVKQYEKGKLNQSNDASTSGKNFYKMEFEENKSLRSGKALVDMLTGHMINVDDTRLMSDYIPWWVFALDKLVSDLMASTGSARELFKKDQSTIAMVTYLKELSEKWWQLTIQNQVKQYLTKIWALSATTPKAINAAYNVYVADAEKLYTDLQKLGKYEITKKWAENSQQIKTILASSKLSPQEKINKLIQWWWIMGDLNIERSDDEFIREIEDQLGNSVIQPTSPNYSLRYKWSKDANDKKIPESAEHQAFVTGMSLARARIKAVYGGNDHGLTVRAMTGAPYSHEWNKINPTQSDHLYIQNFGHKTEIVRQPNGQYALQVWGNLLDSSHDVSKMIMLATVFNFAWTYIGKLGTDSRSDSNSGLTIKDGNGINTIKSWAWMSPTVGLDKINQLIAQVSASTNEDSHNLTKTIAHILNKKIMLSASGQEVPMFWDHGYQTEVEYLAAGVNGEQANIVGPDFKDFNISDPKRLTQKIGDAIAKYWFQWIVDIIKPTLWAWYSIVKSWSKMILHDTAWWIKYVFDEAWNVVTYAITWVTKEVKDYLTTNLPWLINLSLKSANEVASWVIDIWGNAFEQVATKMNWYLAILMDADKKSPWGQFRKNLEKTFNWIKDFSVGALWSVTQELVVASWWVFKELWSTISSLPAPALAAFVSAVGIWLKTAK